MSCAVPASTGEGAAETERELSLYWIIVRYWYIPAASKDARRNTTEQVFMIDRKKDTNEVKVREWKNQRATVEVETRSTRCKENLTVSVPFIAHS